MFIDRKLEKIWKSNSKPTCSAPASHDPPGAAGRHPRSRPDPPVARAGGHPAPGRSGAEVIKIEDPQIGDYARTLGTGSGEDSAYFRMINRNKQGMVLDLKSRKVSRFSCAWRRRPMSSSKLPPRCGGQTGHRLPGGQGAEPEVTYCSISGYGQDGPYKDLAGHDINYLGYAGVLEQIGFEGSQPAIPNFQIADLLGGALTGVMGILAAVVEAQRTGQGRYVDVAMTDSVLAHTYFAMLALNDAGHSGAAGGDLLSGGLPCYATYRCADGKVHGGRGAGRQVLENLLHHAGAPRVIARQWDASLRANMAAPVRHPATRRLGGGASCRPTVA